MVVRKASENLHEKGETSVRDNLTNYLNPSGIEPFIPTKNAGNSTDGAEDINVLSTMTTTETSIDYLPDISVKPIGREGGNWSKSLGDDAEKIGGWPSKSPSRHSINQSISMSIAEAIRILENIETDIYGRIAIGKLIDALRGSTE